MSPEKMRPTESSESSSPIHLVLSQVGADLLNQQYDPDEHNLFYAGETLTHVPNSLDVRYVPQYEPVLCQRNGFSETQQQLFVQLGDQQLFVAQTGKPITVVVEKLPEAGLASKKVREFLANNPRLRVSEINGAYIYLIIPHPSKPDSNARLQMSINTLLKIT